MELPFKFLFFLQTFCFYEAKTSFKLLKIYRSYGTSFQILHFSYKPFASTKQFLKINIDFLKKQPQQYSNSPTLPFSNSTILQFSHSQTLQFSHSKSMRFQPIFTNANFHQKRNLCFHGRFHFGFYEVSCHFYFFGWCFKNQFVVNLQQHFGF